MLTIKYRDERMSESIWPGVVGTSWHEGQLTARLPGNESVSFGPNYTNEPGQNPVAFVMNEAGATVARYEFYPRPVPAELKAQVLDAKPPAEVEPERLAA